MKLLNVPELDAFKRKHADSAPALDAWRREVEAASWRTSIDIKSRYSSASFLANNRVIFNIKGNHYRLVVAVRYQLGIVVVEWVGTHAEYSKKTFE